MTTTRLAVVVCGTALLAATSPTMAVDVRAELTPDLIYEHCVAAGVGSETESTFMLPNGKRITGSVLCGADDVSVANARPVRGGDDDDDEQEGRHHGRAGRDDDDSGGGERGFDFGSGAKLGT
jgi:hypothetical protein